jgi:fumarate reductase subunit C
MPAREVIRIPKPWWSYNRYIVMVTIRELTAVFVGMYAAFLLALIRLDRAQFENVMRSPLSLALQVICLLFAVYHSITWFNLTPQALVLWNGDEKVSPALIAGAMYVVWIGASVGIFLAVS